MKMLTVKQLAEASGVSIRTLHHYDQIGLLKPAQKGSNGYRYYGEEELLRLQQILIHRELDIPLARIGAILDAPDFDRLAALAQQRARLAAEARRYAQLVKTIDCTIENLKGDRAMRNADLYKGISAEKQAGYEKWLLEKYGGDMPERISASRGKYEALSEQEQADLNVELQELEEGLAEGLRVGMQPGAEALDPLLERHRHWVGSMWDKPCPPEAYAGLADLYQSHPDFVARFERLEPGFAAFLAASMKAYAARVAETRGE